jgi:hypothetical protein
MVATMPTQRAGYAPRSWVGSTGKRALAASAVTMGALLLATGCGDITRVTNTSITLASGFNNAQGAAQRRAQALSDFAFAYTNVAYYSGVFSDELTETIATEAPGEAEVDKRNVNYQDPTFEYQYVDPYIELSTAHVSVQRGVQSLEAYVRDSTTNIAELWALSGYIEVMLAEDHCSGVPLSKVVNNVPTLGPTLTRDSLLYIAKTEFDSSLHYATTAPVLDSSIVFLARTGKGRALLDLDSLTAAAAIAALVPATFKYDITFDGNLSQNYIGYIPIALVSLSNHEGGVGLDFVSAGESGDPRIPLDSAQNNGVTAYGLASASLSSSGVLASGIEDQLIVAEAALRAGQVSQWAGILNYLRANAVQPSVGQALSPDSTTLASDSLRINVMFRERALWLALTGERLGDLRRLVRQYGRAANATFPNGSYSGYGGGVYGNQFAFQPANEYGNPNYHGCIDLSP